MRIKAKDPALIALTGEFLKVYLPSVRSGDGGTIDSYWHSIQGYAGWTLRLLAEYCMENQYLVSVSHTAIGDMLNTNELKPHLSRYWCIPKLNDAAFAANMEDVLTIYEMPYTPEIPVICMDEKPVQLLGGIRERIQARPLHTDPGTRLPQLGYCEKIDSEYVWCGTAGIFMFTEPLGGWRHVLAKAHRKRGDFAQMMLSVAEKYYPDVKKIILVADNLNTQQGILLRGV